MPPSRVPAPLKRLVVATGNEGKLREIRSLLADLPFEMIAQSSLGVRPAAESGSSYLANALIKARHAAGATGEAALADDSGLEVEALGGAPGILSARYAGAEADDGANNSKLIAALAGVPAAKRRARYRCVAVYIEGPLDVAPQWAEGVWEGLILDEPRGAGGFGYDPYFWLPELGATAAELAPEEKNRRSHRGRAFAALGARLAAHLDASWP